MQRLEVSCAVGLIYTSLGAKGLMVVPSTKFRENLAYRSLVTTYRQSYVRRRCARLNRIERKLRSALFWAVTQGILVVPYLSFETTFRFREL